MVKTKAQVFRVVLDTNVLVSALLFGGKLPSSDLQVRVNDAPMFGIVQGAIFRTELLKRIRASLKHEEYDQAPQTDDNPPIECFDVTDCIDIR
jgi:hypothetical protein